MIPIVQFDPASLAIFAEGPTMALDKGLLPLINATISGNRSEVAANMLDLSSRKDLGRALQLSSAFLHEKRHFHDFVATTYGAHRFRQFQEIYANLVTVLGAGHRMGSLCLPLEVNLDPIRRRVLGVSTPPAEITAIAQALADRRRRIERDRKLFSSRLGTFEIGGEAQLEALAYTAQSRFVSHFGGVGAHDAFAEHVFDREQFQSKYGAFINLGVAAGIAPVRKLESLNGRTDKVTHRGELDAALLECTIFAALQPNYVPGRGCASAGTIETSYPADRFAAIVTHLAQEYKSLCIETGGLDWEECWEAVDATCAKLFGFRAHEQVALDIEYSETLLREISKSEDEVVIGISEDMLELRKTMCDRLQKTPVRVASTEHFAASVGAGVDPIVVLANSAGELGGVPDGYVRLMGYDTSEEDGQTRPWRKWWWAVAAEDGTFAAQPDALRLKRPELVHRVIDTYAPVAKLLMNGRKIRTLIGPEVLFAEQHVLDKAGIALRFFPGFEFPEDEIPEAVLRFFRLGANLVCDYTNEIIPVGEATVLTPWALRRYPDLAQFTIKHLGGHDLAYHHFVRDWSLWAVSRAMMQTLRPLMQRQNSIDAANAAMAVI